MISPHRPRAPTRWLQLFAPITLLVAVAGGDAEIVSSILERIKAMIIDCGAVSKVTRGSPYQILSEGGLFPITTYRP